MVKWPPYPTLYEINTWPWLSKLREKYGKETQLGTLPACEWDAIADLGFDGVWLMGVWERSPAGIAISNMNEQLLQDFRRALSDYRVEDNVGSAYCVRRYVVDPHLGGAEGLRRARQELAKRGMKLLLDFVPNHVASDHPWVMEHPEYFVHGDEEDLSEDPVTFTQLAGRIFACGRDPYFPAWQDVLQLNAFDAGLRRAVVQTLQEIADQCDGVRCDMAMLLLTEVFERTWDKRAGKPPATEYWREVIPSVKKKYPGFLFIAEAYWDLEWRLQQLGFDFCYDKRLYDRLEHENAESVRLHLCADFVYTTKLLHFLENHDEPRAAAVYSREKEEAAAVLIAALPGARLFYEGQFEGRKVRLPVFLRRNSPEVTDNGLQTFYTTLLKTINRPAFRDGDWHLCERSGWPDNSSFHNLLAMSWRNDSERWLIAVNFSEHPAQARVAPGWPDLGAGKWVLNDVFSGEGYERVGSEIATNGLYVELGPWRYHFFQFSRA